MAPDYYIIGKRIKETRLRAGLTQEQLADKMDVSIAFMSRVERGTSKISLKRLTQVAELLGVSPGYLLVGSNTTSKEYLREDFRILLERCTPEQRKLIYQISELISRVDFKIEGKVREITNTIR